MKNFIQIFLICLLISGTVLFFGGWLIFENIFAMLITFSLLMTFLISIIVDLDDRIEKLENKIKELESK